MCTAQNTVGTAEAQVDVSVEAVHGRSGAPEIHMSPSQTVEAGQTARLHCSATGVCKCALGGVGPDWQAWDGHPRKGPAWGPLAPATRAEGLRVPAGSAHRSLLLLGPAGDPPPAIHWSKLRAPLPWQHQVVNDTLVIPRVAQQDSGQYICNATNAAGFTEAFVALDVESKWAERDPLPMEGEMGLERVPPCCCSGWPPEPEGGEGQMRKKRAGAA